MGHEVFLSGEFRAFYRGRAIAAAGEGPSARLRIVESIESSE